MRIQVWFSGSALVGRDSYEPRTRLISLFKRVWGYPGKNKKKIQFYLKKIKTSFYFICLFKKKLKRFYFLLKLLTKINHFNPISRSGGESWYRLDLINLRKTHRRLSISNANKIQRWDLQELETLKELEAILDRTRIWVGIKRQDRIYLFFAHEM